MLEGPLALWFFNVFMVFSTSFSVVGRRKKEVSEGLRRNSLKLFVVGIISASIFFGISKKNWLKVSAISFGSLVIFPFTERFLIDW